MMVPIFTADIPLNEKLKLFKWTELDDPLQVRRTQINQIKKEQQKKKKTTGKLEEWTKKEKHSKTSRSVRLGSIIKISPHEK